MSQFGHNTYPDSCLGCASCVLACPVSAADPAFAGPKVLGPALNRRLSGGWPGEAAVGADEAAALCAQHCLQCHQCDLACPAGLSVSTMTRRSKTLALRRPNGTLRRSVRRVLAEQERFGRLVAAVRSPRRLARRLSPGLSQVVERTGLQVLGLSPSRTLPQPPSFSLAGWFHRTRPPRTGRAGPPVLFYAGCHARFHDPRAAQAGIIALRAIGYRVMLPPQVCCGSPAFSSGEEDLAVSAAVAGARLLGEALRRAGPGAPIVSPCPSCTLALREHLPMVSRGGREIDPSLVERVAANVWDLGEFLAGPGRPGLEVAVDRRIKCTSDECGASNDSPAWVYHVPCHLRALGAGLPMYQLLSELGVGGNVDLGPVADGCCGMGGLDGLTREGFPRSLAVGQPVLRAYSAEAEKTASRDQLLVVSDCPACRWQISDVTGLTAVHPAELLVRRYRLA